MALIEVVIVLIIVGVLLWLVNTYIPMASPVKSLLNAVVVIALVIWLLQVFGVWHYITNIRVGS
ncbi:MAG: Thivi_2564 family membrane protein [Candidatus Cybelea sp.]